MGLIDRWEHEMKSSWQTPVPLSHIFKLFIIQVHRTITKGK